MATNNGMKVFRACYVRATTAISGTKVTFLVARDLDPKNDAIVTIDLANNLKAAPLSTVMADIGIKESLSYVYGPYPNGAFAGTIYLAEGLADDKEIPAVLPDFQDHAQNYQFMLIHVRNGKQAKRFVGFHAKVIATAKDPPPHLVAFYNPVKIARNAPVECKWMDINNRDEFFRLDREGVREIDLAREIMEGALFYDQQRAAQLGGAHRLSLPHAMLELNGSNLESKLPLKLETEPPRDPI